MFLILVYQWQVVWHEFRVCLQLSMAPCTFSGGDFLASLRHPWNSRVHLLKQALTSSLWVKLKPIIMIKNKIRYLVAIAIAVRRKKSCLLRLQKNLIIKWSFWNWNSPTKLEYILWYLMIIKLWIMSLFHTV